MRPVVYAVDGDSRVTIKFMPEFVSCIGNKPAFWYVRKELRRYEHEEAWKQGLRWWYWRGSDWAVYTPLQFSSAEDALASYVRPI